MTTVFVTGATGFIALHTVKQLISKGYKVIGTVRSESKGEKLVKSLGSTNFKYVIVPDIVAEGAFDQALKENPEIKVFLHTASPVLFESNNIEEELLKPAIRGTKNAFDAIFKYGSQITSVVLTSSFAAVTKNGKDDPVYNEDSWNDMTYEDSLTDKRLGYRGSKTYAEKSAWDFIKNNKVNFTLNVINPSFVFGPQAFDNNKDILNFSAEIVNKYVKLNKDDEIPSFTGGFIDVRDVAKAHIVAFENSSIKNQRLLLWNGKFNSQIILDLIHENFPQLNDKVPKGEPGSGEKLLSLQSQIDNSKSKKLLDFEFISLKQSIVDTVSQILKSKLN
ncbi:hypothetical protein HYPBUDRAFT_107695 [Hyphopichia burtonii NRRL Y-1933]|uniref:NAD-dependent epimerase/dehydratase domain-containing protein n=1 Tax=Hyphopichia burtonii NRRL Y-1933 TaxID=984485 RepID=A0A1E4RM21_9ASCO|nr:hypothetical protein HYPBUDRAFT_107695 [Hyphopichia burtonii NRRL Y-1933]ODV68299.1 hypothetical protein HYPBUDRAFT_107695 [Hyphopichia burtonii NRRL Y-1933]